VLLADLGLAKSLAQASVLTLAAGSAGYQPPEQAEPGEGIDARADVYSLGAVGYELVTGSVPGPPGKVVPPRRLRPDLGEDVERALLRALEPDRERRWPSAQTFAQELERLAAQSGTRRAGRLDGVRGVLHGVTLVVAGVLAAAVAAGAVTLLLHRSGGGAQDETVQDSTGRVSVEVPAGWAKELRDSGWDPHALGLPEGHEPGLVVADRLANWSDLSSAVNGVFVGVAEHGDVAARVDALTHSGCHYAGARDLTGARWRGTVRTWTGCRDGGSVTESALRPATGKDQPQVYIQVRRQGDNDVTDGIIRSLRIT
jgi:hypothetical protein